MFYGKAAEFDRLSLPFALPTLPGRPILSQIIGTHQP
jgi:hypothetical protein